MKASMKNQSFALCAIHFFHQIWESDHFKIVIFNGVTEMMVG